jgi:hypothetical protein
MIFLPEHKLITSSDWPPAVNPFLICKEECDELKKAEAILELMINEPLDNKTFLQISLGKPYCADLAPNYGAKISDGIDLNTSKLTINQNYDLILLFDVLDHVNDFQQIFKKIKNYVNPQGFVYVRFHPFNSRHATHDYVLNKAYSHFFLNRSPLKHNGPKDYKKLIDVCGFKIVYEREYPVQLEDFFINGKGKIIKKFSPQTIQFIDYKLKHT